MWSWVVAGRACTQYRLERTMRHRVPFRQGVSLDLDGETEAFLDRGGGIAERLQLATLSAMLHLRAGSASRRL